MNNLALLIWIPFTRSTWEDSPSTPITGIDTPNMSRMSLNLLKNLKKSTSLLSKWTLDLMIYGIVIFPLSKATRMKLLMTKRPWSWSSKLCNILATTTTVQFTGKIWLATTPKIRKKPSSFTEELWASSPRISKKSMKSSMDSSHSAPSNKLRLVMPSFWVLLLLKNNLKIPWSYKSRTPFLLTVTELNLFLMKLLDSNLSLPKLNSMVMLTATNIMFGVNTSLLPRANWLLNKLSSSTKRLWSVNVTRKAYGLITWTS